MTWGAYTTHAPPLLTAGDVVQFASREALASLIDPELSQRRLLCINLIGLPLYQARTFKFRVAGGSGEVVVRGQGVHLQSDLVGLQVECDPPILVALKALAGPVALGAARRAAALALQPAGPLGATPTPTPVSAPPLPATPRPAPQPMSALVPAAPTLAPDDSHGDSSLSGSASPADTQKDLFVSGIASPVDLTKDASLSGIASGVDSQRDASQPDLATPTPAFGSSPGTSSGSGSGSEHGSVSGSEHGSVSGLASGADSIERLWVEPTRVEEPWDLGGLLLQRTEPPRAPDHAGDPPSLPSRSVDLTPAPTPTPTPPIRAGVHGGVGLGAFVAPGHTNTLFRWLAEQVQAGRPGRVELSASGRPLELALDGRGGVVSFTAMGSGGPEQDPQELRAERRHRLAQVLVPWGERAHVEVTLTPDRPAPRPGEKSIPLLEALVQWIDLALTPVGAEPAIRHYHRHLFNYPVARRTEGWGPERLPLDRLQSRFVDEALTSGRTLQDILAFSPLGRPRTWRMIVLLDALGLLVFESEPPAAGRQGALTDMLETLRLRESQGAESRFAALGVHFASHPSEYAGALERIVAKYGPGSPVAQGSTETRKLGEQIVARAREAGSFLADPQRRVEYRRELLTPMEIRAAVELLVGQYRLAMMRKLPDLSQQLAEVVLELDPGALARPP